MSSYGIRCIRCYKAFNIYQYCMYLVRFQHFWHDDENFKILKDAFEQMLHLGSFNVRISFETANTGLDAMEQQKLCTNAMRHAFQIYPWNVLFIVQLISVPGGKNSHQQNNSFIQLCAGDRMQSSA